MKVSTSPSSTFPLVFSPTAIQAPLLLQFVLKSLIIPPHCACNSVDNSAACAARGPAWDALRLSRERLSNDRPRLASHALKLNRAVLPSGLEKKEQVWGQHSNTWLYLAASGCIWLHLAASGCIWFSVFAHGCIWLHIAAHDCTWLHMSAHASTRLCGGSQLLCIAQLVRKYRSIGS